MYWENSDDVFNKAMSDAMSRNRFEEIISVFHLADNHCLTILTPSDAFKKVRPFYSMINEKCLWSIFSIMNVSLSTGQCFHITEDPVASRESLGSLSEWVTRCGCWLRVLATLFSLSRTRGLRGMELLQVLRHRGVWENQLYWTYPENFQMKHPVIYS